jgi:hypothetical protein
MLSCKFQLSFFLIDDEKILYGIKRGVQWPLQPMASREQASKRPAKEVTNPLKKFKIINQLRETNTPPRVDENTYCKSDCPTRWKMNT